MQLSMMTPVEDDTSEDNVRWFPPDGCVEYHGETTKVFVGGTLVGSYGKGEEATRNLLLVNLAKEPRIRKGRLAWAFSLSAERVRQLRLCAEEGGVEALLSLPGSGRKPKVTPEIRKKIFSMFDAGHHIRDVWSVVSERNERWAGMSRWTVCDLRTEWLAAQGQQPVASGPEPEPQVQLELAEVVRPCPSAVVQDEPVPAVLQAAGVQAEQEPGGEAASGRELAAAPLRGGNPVPHVGGWLLVAMVHALGLHDAVQQGWQAPGCWGHRLRMALDAVVLALGLGQRCVEGVRRLKPPAPGCCCGPMRRPQQTGRGGS